MFKELRYPPTAYWEVTDFCNHECIHCFNYWRTDKEFVPCMKTEEENLIIARKIIEQKPVNVVITGGEPLAVFEYIHSSIELFLENSIAVSVNTNAVLLDEEKCDFFHQHRIGLFISFPSYKEEEFDQIVNRKGAFDSVRKSLHLLREKEVHFSCNMVVSKVNLNSIYETAKFVKEEFGLKRLSVTRVSMPVNARDHFDEYMLSREDMENYMEMCVKAEKELDMHISASSPFTPCSLSTQEQYDMFANKHMCTAGKLSYVVSVNGGVRACVRDSKEYGNLLVNDFEEIWKGMREWRDDSLLPVECEKCSHLPKCQGGCRTDGLPLHNCRDRLDNYSDPTKASVQYVNRGQYLPRWDFMTKFVVAKDLKVVKETDGFRVTSGNLFEFCTDKLWEYLKDKERFSVCDFCEDFNIDINRAIQVLCKLQRKRIIQVKR